MSEQPPPGSDEAQLSALGYQQELSRGLGGFHNFALSFSVVSILTGAVTLYGHGLEYGGPWVMAVGWPVVSVLTLAIAASLAELASAYPTAGALYHWASWLGGRGAGWLTAWLNTLGQFAITAAIDFGLAEFLAPLLGLGEDRTTVLGLYALVLLSHGLLNHVGVRWVAALNTASAYFHVFGVVFVVVAVWALAPKQPLGFLLTTHAHADVPLGWSLGLALLQPAWTFTGYDASAHASEETKDAATAAPRGMLLAVGVSAIAGWALLLAVTLAVPSLELVLAQKNPLLFTLTAALGELGRLLVWVAVVAMWFCGFASVTSNSRMLYAFARDGGLPGSALLRRVSPRYQSPHVAVWVAVVVAALLALWASALSVMAALSTVALYLSYGLPVALALRARRRGLLRQGPWALGRHGPWVNALALVWIAAATVLMSVPPNGLAGLTLLATLAGLAVWWWADAGKRFGGPPAPRG